MFLWTSISINCNSRSSSGLGRYIPASPELQFLKRVIALLISSVSNSAELRRTLMLPKYLSETSFINMSLLHSILKYFCFTYYKVLPVSQAKYPKMTCKYRFCLSVRIGFFSVSSTIFPFLTSKAERVLNCSACNGLDRSYNIFKMANHLQEKHRGLNQPVPYLEHLVVDYKFANHPKNNLPHLSFLPS